MSNHAAQQSLNLLRPGEIVLLNIGLGATRQGRPVLSAAKAVGLWASRLRELLSPGFRGEAREGPHERVFVVAGRFRSDVSYSTLLWDTVVESGQDCIAIWYGETGEGALLGPNADQWGPFKAEHFIKPSWLHSGVVQ